jgi:hypothetical protein
MEEKTSKEDRNLFLSKTWEASEDYVGLRVYHDQLLTTVYDIKFLLEDILEVLAAKSA